MAILYQCKATDAARYMYLGQLCDLGGRQRQQQTVYILHQDSLSVISKKGNIDSSVVYDGAEVRVRNLIAKLSPNEN